MKTIIMKMMMIMMIKSKADLGGGCRVCAPPPPR